MVKTGPVVLLVLDGWGYRENLKYNAIAAAKTPQWDFWWNTCPHILLEASGLPVGLPEEQMGNSEVGHMHIGAGRRIPQDFTRIGEAITRGEFAKNEVFLRAISDMKRQQKAIHVLSLLSPGGVHSHEEHLFAFLDMCKEQQFHQVFLHLFLDGRDTPPQSASESLTRLETYLHNNPVAQICSVSGRYYAMDRDQRWERIEPVFHLINEGTSKHQFASAGEALAFFYDQNIFDEFIPPTLIGQPHPIENKDSVVFLNFRADRARQLTQAFILDDMAGFTQHHKPTLAHFITMTRYAKNLATEVAFPPLTFHNTLGEVLAQQGLRQLRIAETEKYAHVTFFFNGGQEKPFINEERILIPSPCVATYDLQPEMSAPLIAEHLVNIVKEGHVDVIICNFANADMVGHTGNFHATVQAIECLDRCLELIGNAVSERHGHLLITADHGNAETMFDDKTHQAHTAHTTDPVPFLYVGNKANCIASRGDLCDIAPTILTILGIKPPQEMTGQTILQFTND